MLAGIGVIIFLKQIPHAIGYDNDYAKRQLTWLRGIQVKEVVDSLDSSQMKQCEQVVLAHYQMI